MKTILIFLTCFLSVGALRADLILELDFASPKIKLVVKIKEDKIRYDILPDNGYGNISRIVDLKAGDDFILDHVPKRIANPSVFFGQTNAITKAEWPKFEDTGEIEMLNGYEAQIYKWTNSEARTETLWVAKNYPNFEQIKNDLSKLDKLNNRKWMPELSSLSGMPLKLLIAHNSDVANGADVPFTLLSAKEESIDNSTFEPPKDYHYYGLQTAPPPTNGLLNATITTNLDQWKAAITNLHNDPANKENWIMRQSDTNAGVRLIISGKNQTWMEFDSNFININVRTNSDDIDRIEIQGVEMNIAQIRVSGDALSKVMGTDKSNFNAWCDKMGNRLMDAPLFSSDKARLENGEMCRFEMLASHNSEKPWMINFIITDR